MKCKKRRNDGEPCGAQAIAGTDACKTHAGRPLVEQKARGAVALEVRSWGLTDELVDSTQVMLRLLAQASRRVEHYSWLLEQAYDAAERLRVAEDRADMGEPPSIDNSSDRDRAVMDLERIFNTGGVAALIGHTYASSGGETGGVYAAGEAIRALVELEAAERDRAFRFAEKCRAANLDERVVKLAEDQGRLVASLMRDVLTDLAGLLAAGEITTVDPSQAPVLRVLSTRLRALDGNRGAAA